MLDATILKLDTYTPRTPRKNKYYRLVEANFEQLERIWDTIYKPKYGYWRPYITLLSTNISIAEILILALQGLSVKAASMNTFCHFLVNDDISVLPAIKRELWNLENSCMKKCWKMYHIDNGYLLCQNDSALILCTIANFLLRVG